jgi:uncharacterized repeat protein (TIGR01451 family)
VAAALIVLVALHLLAFSRPQQALAQGEGTLGLEISKELVGDTTISVGQVITFKIVVKNTGSLSVTDLVVEDTYDTAVIDPVELGIYAESDDPPLSDTEPYVLDAANTTITWSGLELAPGEELTILVRFRAVHPTEELLTVNYARIKEATRSGVKKEVDIGDDADGDVRGNNAPVFKELAVDGEVRVGTLVTFTIEVNNEEGSPPIEVLPLTDNYNPTVLEFVSADPPVSSNDDTNGVLEWSDLLAMTGLDQLGPGESIFVTTVYRTLQPFDGSVNEAEVDSAEDQYENTLDPDAANAPIQIVPAQEIATTTSTPAAAATATSTPAITATATSTATATQIATTAPTLTPFPTSRPDDDDDDDDDDDEREEATTVARPTRGTPYIQHEDAIKTIWAVQGTIVTEEAAVATATATSTPAQATATTTLVVPGTLPRTGSNDPQHSYLWWLGAALVLLVAGTLVGALGQKRKNTG